MPNYKYMIMFHTGLTVLLEQESLNEAFEYVEKMYGNSWRNILDIVAWIKVDA